MLKSKAWIVGLLVALATGVPAPSAQASELVKLGKLLITGKRTPTPEVKPAAEKPASPRQEASNGVTERPASHSSSRLSVEALADIHQADDWPERAVESRQTSQPAADNVPRNGPSTAPQPGAGAANIDVAF